MQLHSVHIASIVKWRALSGCCMATSLVACPSLAIAWELIYFWGGIGGDTAAVLPGLELGSPFILKFSVDNAHM